MIPSSWETVTPVPGKVTRDTADFNQGGTSGATPVGLMVTERKEEQDPESLVIPTGPVSSVHPVVMLRAVTQETGLTPLSCPPRIMFSSRNTWLYGGEVVREKACRRKER